MTEQQTTILYMVLLALFQSGVLVTVLRAAKTLIEQRLGPERARVAADLAAQCVQAVEQLDRRYQWSSAQKMDEALKRARDLGASHGVQLSESQWRSLIEAAVGSLTQMQAALGASVPLEPAAPYEVTSTSGAFVAADDPRSSVAPPLTRQWTAQRP